MNAEALLRPLGGDPLSSPSHADKRAATQSGSGNTKPLPVTFRQGGWIFQQLARNSGAYLYLKSKPGAEGRLIQSWEIVVPNRCKARSFPSGKFHSSTTITLTR